MKRLHLSVESNEISLVLYLYLKEFHATFSNKKKKSETKLTNHDLHGRIFLHLEQVPFFCTDFCMVLWHSIGTSQKQRSVMLMFLFFVFCFLCLSNHI